MPDRFVGTIPKIDLFIELVATTRSRAAEFHEVIHYLLQLINNAASSAWFGTVLTDEFMAKLVPNSRIELPVQGNQLFGEVIDKRLGGNGGSGCAGYEFGWF